MGPLQHEHERLRSAVAEAKVDSPAKDSPRALASIHDEDGDSKDEQEGGDDRLQSKVAWDDKDSHVDDDDINDSR